ncbi:MAG: GDSL-type esterase/lipase family protein [Prolixibacteraceae bacterium]
MKRKLLTLLFLLANIIMFAQGNRSFYIDLGPNDVTNGNITVSPDKNGTYWNNLVNNSSAAAALSLITGDNQLSDATITIRSNFDKNGILNGALLDPSEELLGEFAIPTATQDYFFTTVKAEMEINGLDTSKSYVFSLFASRNSPSARISKYTFSGKNEAVAYLQSSGENIGGSGIHGNNSNVLVSQKIQPDDSGQIRLTLEVAEGGFAYINFMKIVEAAPTTKMYFDFGLNDGANGTITTSPDLNGNYWNNIISNTANAVTTNLVTTENHATTVQLNILTAFQSNGIQNGGLLEPNSARLGEMAIATASQDYFFTTSNAAFELSGLDTVNSYIFSFFGSRNTESKRVTQYTLTGENLFTNSLQTSGFELGGAGYHGNNSLLLISDTLKADKAGKIKLELAVVEGGFAYLNFMIIESIERAIPPAVVELCKEKDSLLIAIMGSSVANGTGATNNQGYAYQFIQILKDRSTSGEGEDWAVENISVGGNTTVDVKNRWEDDLLPLCSRYVVYGLSLGNEGVHEKGEPMFVQFRDNLLALIDSSRTHGIEPVVVNNYTRSDYTTADYKFIKDINLLIHQWDVASVNVLGAVDDGVGHWAPGYWNDGWHPNLAGHKEFAYAFVPSLFDALHLGKKQPEKVETSFMELGTTNSSEQITFTPDNIVHPFTISVDYQTTQEGTIVAFEQNKSYGRVYIESNSGYLMYVSPSGNKISTGTIVNDNNWHNITLTHFYARGETQLYSDAKLLGSLKEKLVPEQFYLNTKNAPEQIGYKNWFFYRSGMNAEEIASLNDGEMLKSSLELYAPLDGLKITESDPLINLAQSTTTLKMETAISTALNEVMLNQRGGFSVYPNPITSNSVISYYCANSELVDISLYNTNGQKLKTIFHGNASIGWNTLNWNDLSTQIIFNEGLYILRFNSGTENIHFKIFH